MKGPSLQRQYNKIQEEIKEKVAKYKATPFKHNFPAVREGMIKSLQSFDVQENPYSCADYPGVGSCTVMPIRYSRWEMYIFDEEKFNVCKSKDPKDIKCKECQSCGLWDVDGHYKIPCAGIMKIGFDL